MTKLTSESRGAHSALLVCSLPLLCAAFCVLDALSYSETSHFLNTHTHVYVCLVAFGPSENATLALRNANRNSFQPWQAGRHTHYFAQLSISHSQQCAARRLQLRKSARTCTRMHIFMSNPLLNSSFLILSFLLYLYPHSSSSSSYPQSSNATLKILPEKLDVEFYIALPFIFFYVVVSLHFFLMTKTYI